MRDPSILMGQRGAKAAFMPNKFVFPGGAVDPQDAAVPLAAPCRTPVTHASPMTRPTVCSTRSPPPPFASSGKKPAWCWAAKAAGIDPVPEDWRRFADTGHLPAADRLQFVFRALTPPGRPRRFDARFFLVDAGDIQGDLDDFTHASDELSHLQWIPLTEARSFDLPFITEVVLAEVEGRITDPAPPESVPYFKNNDEASLFLRLRGQPMPEHD